MNRRSRPKIKRNPLLPIVGLVFAALLLVVSYVLAPMALDAAGTLNDKFNTNIRVNNNPDEELIPELFYGSVFVMWLVLMGLATTLVAVAIGKDPDREVVRGIPASPANKAAIAKQLKRDLRDAKRREKELAKKKK